MNSIDIDVGGTFTDLVLNFNGQTLIKKVPDDSLRPLGVLLARDRGRRGDAGNASGTIAAGHRHDPLLDDDRHEPADRAKRAAAGLDYHRRARRRGR